VGKSGMVVDTISTPLVSFAGSGVVGFFIGMLLRRVLHILLIIVGAFLGALFLAIQYMAHKGYLGNVQIDWTHIGNDTASYFQSLATQFSHLWRVGNSGHFGLSYRSDCGSRQAMTNIKKARAGTEKHKQKVEEAC
jgi:uncharacterized membrane protein (Fun14 family)